MDSLQFYFSTKRGCVGWVEEFQLFSHSFDHISSQGQGLLPCWTQPEPSSLFCNSIILWVIKTSLMLVRVYCCRPLGQLKGIAPSWAEWLSPSTSTMIGINDLLTTTLDNHLHNGLLEHLDTMCTTSTVYRSFSQVFPVYLHCMFVITRSVQ